MRTNYLLRSPLPLLSALMLAGYAQAQSPYVGVNWEGRSPNTPVGPYGFAGIPTAKQSHWNDVREEGYTSFSGTTPALNDKAGNATPVTLTFAANDSWNNDGPTATADDRLMRGVIKAGGSNTTDTFTFNNVPAGVYDLIVYLDVNGDGVPVTLTNGSVAYFVTEMHQFSDTTGYVQASNIVDPALGGIRDVGNYVRFAGISPASGAITVTMTYPGIAGDGAGMAALQLLQAVDTVGPALATATLLDATHVKLKFDENLNLAHSPPYTDVSHYSIDRGVTVSSAVVNDPQTVTLTVSAVTGLGNYVVTATDLVDTAGNSTASSSAGFTKSLPATLAPYLGANFEGRGSAVALGSGDVAGYLRQGHWNNIHEEILNLDGAGGNVDFSGTSGPLNDFAGNATPVTLTFQANDSWNNDGPSTTPDEKLMRGVIKAGGNNAGVLTPSTDIFSFNNVPRGSYYLVIYANVNGDGVQVDFSAGGTTLYIIEAHQFAGAYSEAFSADPTARDSGNFVAIPVSPDNWGRIEFTMRYAGVGGDGAGMAAVQLVKASGADGPALVSATFTRDGPTFSEGHVTLKADKDATGAGGFSINKGVTISNAQLVDARTAILTVSNVIAGDYIATATGLVDAGGNVTASSSAVIAVPIASTVAPAISVNFKGGEFNGNGPTGLDPSDVAGVVPLANWNNADGKLGDASLVDNDNHATAVTVHWDAAEAWGSGTFPAGGTDGNHKLFSGWIGSTDGANSPSNFVQFANVPLGNYDVYVYSVRDGAGAGEGIMLNEDPTTTFHIEQESHDLYNLEPAFVLGTNQDATLHPVANYVLFANVQPLPDATMSVRCSSETFGTMATFRGAISGIQLICHDATPILIIAQPQSQSVAEGCPFSFSVEVTGCGFPRTYKWFCNGKPLDGQTSSTYSGIASASQNGNAYYVVITDPAGSATSATVTLQVAQNPRAKVWGSRGNCHAIYVTYNQPMRLDGQYSVICSNNLNGTVTQLTITNITYGESQSVVCLALKEVLVEDINTYCATVLGAHGANGLVVAPNPSVCWFKHGAEFPCVRILYRDWFKINGGLGTLYADPRFPCNPDDSRYDSTSFGADAPASNLGLQVSGFYIAPQDGDYRFWLSADDPGELFVATDAYPGHKVSVVSYGGANGRRAFKDANHGSAPITLTAGQKIYLEADDVNGGGGGQVSVTVTINDPATPPNGTGEIDASNFMQMRFAPNCPCAAAFFSKVCDVFVTRPPTDTCVYLGQQATFAVEVDGTPCYSYQWKLNGAPIPGANASSYTTLPAVQSNNNDAYTVVVGNSFSSVESLPGHLCILPNPILVSCNAHCSNNTIIVTYDKPVHLDGVYSLGAGAPGLSAPRYGASMSQVLLDLDGSQTPATDYTLTITGVTSLDGSTIFPNPTLCPFHYGWFIPNSTDFGRFNADFSNGILPPGTAVFGNLGFAYADASGILHLTDSPAGGAYGAWAIPDLLSGAPLTTLDVQWQSLFGNPSGGGADGFSFNWGPDLPNNPPFFGEEGIGSGLNVTIDTYNNATAPMPNEIGLELTMNGIPLTDLATGKPSFTAVGGGTDNSFLMKNQFVDAELTVDVLGHVSFTYDGLNVQGDIPNWAGIAIPAGQNWAFMFGARTGGASENCWIRHVRINTVSDGPPIILSGPDDATVQEGQVATFSVSVDGVQPLSYQWKSNGVPIAGATGFSFSTPPTTFAGYNGTHWSVMVSNDCGMATSPVATLTVLQSPLVVNCYALCVSNQVHVIYNRPVNLDGAYTLDNAETVVGVARGASQNEVVLTVDPLLSPNTTYTLTIQDVHSQAGVVIAPNPATCAFQFGLGGFVTHFDDLDPVSGLPVLPPGTLYCGPHGIAAGDGIMHLTDGGDPGIQTAFLIPDQNGGAPVDNLRVRWKSKIGNGTGATQFGQPGADGYSLDWAPNLPVPGVGGCNSGGPEGTGSGVTVTIDTFDNGGFEAPGIEIKWLGARVAFDPIVPGDQGAAKAFLFKNEFVDAELTVTPPGVATFTYDGHTISAPLPGFAPMTGAGYLFGAGTGGAAADQWIADVIIETATLSVHHNGSDVVIDWRNGCRLQCTTKLESDATLTVWQDVTDPTTGLPVKTPYVIRNPCTHTVALDAAQEVPPNGGRTGSGFGTITLSGTALTFNNITYSGLSGTVVIAHIHGPALPGQIANPLYQLTPTYTSTGGHSGSINGTLNLVAGTGGLTIAQQLAQLNSGQWYINIHTGPAFGGGEIRGQIEPRCIQAYRVASP